MTTNVENRAQRFIQRLYDAPTEQLGEMMRLRLLGDLGPALEVGQSWAELLADAYRTGNADFQDKLKQHLLDILYAYSRPSKFQQLNQAELADWQQFSTALILASEIDWPENQPQTQDLQGLLNNWLSSALEPLPQPRDITNETRRPGYPQIDLLSCLLTMVRKLPLDWDTGLANKLWKSIEAEQAHTTLQQRAKAERLWEMAAWALHTHNNQAILSLASHIDTLSESLETADWQPGNLTLLFLRAELNLEADEGTRRVAKLICKVPHPEVRSRRTKLAIQLDYFAEDNQATRQRLAKMYHDKTEQTPRSLDIWFAREMFTPTQNLVDSASQHAQQMQAMPSIEDYRSRVIH